MTNAELTEYYVNTLLLEYITKPKARQTIQVLVGSVMLLELLTDVRDGYNVQNAVGLQLDVLGKYAGVGRAIVGFSNSIEFFGYLLYSESPPKTGISGYVVYGDTGIVPRFKRYIDNNSTVYTMTDAQYRFMIQLKIFKNHSNGSLESIDFIMQSIFEDRYHLVDSEDMLLHYAFQESDRLLVSIAEFVGLVPKPTGVGFEISFVPDAEHIFGFKQYGVTAPTDFVGFKLYGVAKAGGMASYV